MRKFIGRSTLVASLFAIVFAVGCAGHDFGGGFGGGGFVGQGSVSGVVYDQNGNPLRNAAVSYVANNPRNSLQTTTTTSGAYVLTNLPALNDLIQCQVTSNGVQYTGQNLAAIFNNQQTSTVNITVFPVNQQGTISGTVADSRGNLLVGASVYAKPQTLKAFTSSYGITDFRGNFSIGGLVGGQAYSIQSNALGYNSAFDTETVSAGQTINVNYTLSRATNTTLAPPTDVAAVAYTSPAQATSSSNVARAIKAARNFINPSMASRHVGAGRVVSNNLIDVEVSFAPVVNTSLLGFGIYRGPSAGQLQNIDFLQDPQAQVYEDMSGALTTGVSYTYAVTTVSTGLTNTTGESALSATASVQPLGPMGLATVSSSDLPTFTWSAAQGASSYGILLYNQFPDINVSPIFSNLTNPVSGTTFTYNGPALTSGTTYYYILVGQSANGKTFSTVGQFTAP